MVNEEILGALQAALTRGESLKKAMMTLYNAGYKKEDISEAAHSAQAVTPVTQPQTPVAQPAKKSIKGLFKKTINPAQQQTLQQAQQIPQQSPPVDMTLAPPKELTKAEQPLQSPQQQIPQQVPQQQIPSQQPTQPQQPGQAPQRVSGYGQPPKPAGKTIIILLGFLLLLLIGILVAIFLFKDELINFFNNLFD